MLRAPIFEIPPPTSFARVAAFAGDEHQERLILKNSLKDAVLRFLAVRKHVSVGASFHVGPGSTIWAPTSLKIGREVYVGKNVTIEADGVIGDGVLFANLSGLVGRRDHDIHHTGVSIRRSRWVGDFPDELSRSTLIGSDVWVGYGAVILSGVVIGDSAVIAAGAVVIGDVPSNTIVAGNPARAVGSRFSAEDLHRHWNGLRESGYRILVGEGTTET